MGWKTINGRRYYYRSVREGGRVRSRYVGGGDWGVLCARTDELLSIERAVERDERRQAREQADAEEREFREWFDRIEAVARAALVAAGYHDHKGQWRRVRRDGGFQPEQGPDEAEGSPVLDGPGGGPSPPRSCPAGR